MSSKSRHQPKERQDHQNSSNTHNQAEEKSTKRHVYIEPGVQIDIVQDLKNQHKAERQEDTAAHKKQLLWTKITAFLVVAYTSVMIWQACLTRQSINDARSNFNAYYRPFIGVSGIDVTKVVSGRGSDQRAVGIKYSIAVKNFGPVPGEGVVINQKIWFGNEETPAKYNVHVPDKPAILFPGHITDQVGTVVGPYYQQIVNGDIALRIAVTAEYDGPAGHYSYCTMEQYSADQNQFMNLGACK